ncbi:D-alanyl-D-alanine carboxypeptidase [Polaribacter sp. Hel1_85]|nr:D-alanyl-D-alanine carboxypeptidase [Polaribacter sp. Hel1_85]
MDSTYQANRDAIGIMIHVESPNKNISWTSAVGYSNKNTKEKINKDQPLLIASNTKTYVSATILKLVENGHIELDQPIKRLLHKKTKKLLNKNGYDLNKITIKHLLSHTSGITDYVNNNYFEFVDKNPNYKWTRDEQIELAMQIANPIQAGKTFAYGDINYLLLSEIIESTTGKPFYISIRELLDFKGHHLNTTWFIDLEDKPLHSLPLAHQYADIYDWDSYNLNPSWDLYGGGGLASNTKDLALFFQLLFEGKIIKDVNILSKIYSYVIPKEQSKNYCLGLYNFPSFFGNKAFYHGGWWGTDVIYLPELNTTISVLTLLKERRGLNAEISREIIKILNHK